MGDALHAISWAVGCDLRWLIRAVTRLGTGSAFLSLLETMLSAAKDLRTLQKDTRGHTPTVA